MHKTLLLTLALTASFSEACVSKAKYDDLAKTADQARADLARRGADADQHDKANAAELARLNDALAAAAKALQERDNRLSDASVNEHNLQAKLDESTAINQQIRRELERLGKNVDGLLADKGTLSKSLDDAKSRLEELRKAQEAAEARAALLKQLIGKFQKMIDAGELKVVLRDGRMVLQLPNDVLFDSGKIDLKTAGQAALKQIAAALKTIGNRRFQVGGHSDNVPIQTSRFPSNWELSAARAVEVVRFLVAQGVNPNALSAAGYGEFDAIAKNDTPDNRSKNRRIEISIQPDISELVAVPEAKPAR